MGFLLNSFSLLILCHFIHRFLFCNVAGAVAGDLAGVVDEEEDDEE